jgi:acetyltransferase
VSRYVINPDGLSCEFSLVTAEDMKGRGLGTRLMEGIMDVARDRGLKEIMGFVLTTNVAMLRLARTLGFDAKRSAEDPEFVLVSRSL